MFASHAAVTIGLVFLGVILLTLFLFSSSAGMWLSQHDKNQRLTSAEWAERAAWEAQHDAD